ncbi:MAG: MBL fold metallo-hydrolase [Polyangiaceae bacterium]
MSAARGRGGAARAKRRIHIRMYNVGFGDSFLITFDTEDGVTRRVLVDCGYHTKGPGKFNDASLVEQIKDHIRDETETGRRRHRLDVVVATHRHQDHISGFGESDAWKDVGVEEVWLPFTAKPGASGEHAFLGSWERLIGGLGKVVDEQGKLAGAAASAMAGAGEKLRDDVAFMLWNARTNAPGIENLTSGMRRADGRASKRRYLPEGAKDVPFAFESVELPGVKIHVLGPSKDPKYRSKRTAPAEWGLAGGGAEVQPVVSPFGPEWQVPPQELPTRLPFSTTKLQTIASFNGNLGDAALAVEGFVNGESLVLVLEIGAARLLLPGDAEVGSWLKILGDPEAVALVESATFLKVGHHGSHNATPLVLLREHLAKKTPAMMSTQKGEGSFRNGIPFADILGALSESKMPLARSDEPDNAPSPFKKGDDGKWIDLEIDA